MIKDVCLLSCLSFVCHFVILRTVSSSVCGILQARILEWVAVSSSFILDSKKLWKEH